MNVFGPPKIESYVRVSPNIEIIDLGMHPYADTFLSEKRLVDRDSVYPLVVEMYPHTGLIQTKYRTDPIERYSEYSYTSSNSKFARNHWDEFYTSTSKYVPDQCAVVEIGSNDGYLAAQYLPNEVIGVDASHEMGMIARREGIMPITALFNAALGKQLVKEFRNIRLVISNNVLNHADNLFDFVEGVDAMLTNSGWKQVDCKWVFEVPYWETTVSSGRIDQVYHEHVTYFTVKYLKYVLSLFRIVINDVELIDYHGGSLRVTASKSGAESPKVAEMIHSEKYLFQLNTYINLMQKVKRTKYETLKAIYDLKLRGNSIVGIGAAAKGNTWLNFLSLNASVIDCVTDTSELKQGKFLPLSRIPIRSDEFLKAYNGGVYAMILSWNITDQLKEKLMQVNPKIKFI